MIKLLYFTLLLCCCLSLPAQNTNLTNGLLFEGEPFIAQNPANSQHLVVAWMGFVLNSGSGLTIKTKTTFDGGNTWSNTAIIPHISEAFAAADPSLAVADNGDVVLCYIDHSENPYAGGVYFRRSTDGGLTWGEAVLAIDIFADQEKYPIDRPWFVMSPDGQFIYLTSMPPSFVPGPNRPYVFQSSDSGLSWTTFEYLDGTGGLVGNLVDRPMPAPAYGGNYFYALYPSFVFSQNPLPTMIVSREEIGTNVRTYYQALSAASTAEPGFAKVAYKLLCDPSNPNHLTALFVTGEGTDLDIMAIDSYDAAATWSSPLRVNDDPLNNDRMQDMVWGDYDSDGDLCVAWRDRRNADGPGYEQSTEIYAARRGMGETAFDANIALTTSQTQHDGILELNGNDFMCIAFENDTLHSVWGSTTDGSLDIWYNRRNVAEPLSTEPALLNAENKLFELSNNSDHWLFYSVNGQPMESITILQADGKILFDQRIGAMQYQWAKGNCPSGMAVIRVTVGGKSQCVKMILD